MCNLHNLGRKYFYTFNRSHRSFLPLSLPGKSIATAKQYLPHSISSSLSGEREMSSVIGHSIRRAIIRSEISGENNVRSS